MDKYPIVIVVDGIIGAGKCLDPDTKIPCFNGNIKKASEIVVGDKILGDNSTPRIVLSTTLGIDEMYEIKPIIGEPFKVNQHHMLTLKSSFSIFDISVKDFLEKPEIWRESCQLIRSSFDWDEQKVLIHPWIMGFYLGKKTIQEYMKKYFKEISINERLKYYNVIHRRRIPKIYLLNKKQVRIELLAGLLDSYGMIYDTKYHIKEEDLELANDILFLARSLGYYTVMTKEGDFWNISIEICAPLSGGFQIKHIGRGTYNGFEVDGNGRFLLNDFTVTHNSTYLNMLVSLLTKHGMRITLVKEPIEKWNESIGGEPSLFQLFNSNPKRWAYHFQTKVFVDRVAESRQMYERYKDRTDVFVLERSCFTDPLFMHSLYDQGIVLPQEMRDYKEWASLWTSVMPYEPDLFIYLKPPIEVCMKRLKERSRKGEEEISMEYQKMLQDKHDEFFRSDFVVISEGHFVPCIKIETSENFRDDETVREKLTETFFDTITELKNNRRKI